MAQHQATLAARWGSIVEQGDGTDTRGNSASNGPADRRPQLDDSYYRELFANLSDAVVLLSADDLVLEVNRAFERIFGYTGEEACGRFINDLIVPAQRGHRKERLRRRGAVDGPSVYAERRLQAEVRAGFRERHRSPGAGPAPSAACLWRRRSSSRSR